MKKVSKSVVSRIPAFVFYGLVVVAVVVGLIEGNKNGLFLGAAMYIIGMILDPKSDLYRKD